jgi:hypothetical protein
MIEIQIDLSSLEDVRSTSNSVVRQSIESAAREVLNSGGRIVVKRSYENAPDDIFRVFTDAESFTGHLERIFRLAVEKAPCGKRLLYFLMSSRGAAA